jgi:hypothetical protein
MCFTSKDIADALIVKIEYYPLLPITGGVKMAI